MSSWTVNSWDRCICISIHTFLIICSEVWYSENNMYFLDTLGAIQLLELTGANASIRCILFPEACFSHPNFRVCDEASVKPSKRAWPAEVRSVLILLLPDGAYCYSSIRRACAGGWVHSEDTAAEGPSVFPSVTLFTNHGGSFSSFLGSHDGYLTKHGEKK